MDRATIHGVTLEVEHIPGPAARAPLIFLHEGLGSVAMWRQRGQDWPRALCAAVGREGWLYSRRGYGQSDPVPDVRGEPRRQGNWPIGRHQPDYMHLEAWQVLPQLLRALGVALPPVLIGHSDGATIALLHASRCPVSACVAMAPHVFVEDIAIQSIDQTRQRYEEDASGQGFRARLARYHRDVDNAFWQWNDVWLSPAFRTFDIRAECQSIRCPVLAVQGREDEYGSLRQIHEIELGVAGARSIVLDPCGHSPHRDQPERLTQAIAGFLQDIP